MSKKKIFVRGKAIDTIYFRRLKSSEDSFSSSRLSV